MRLRVEGERIGLPGPALTPYLVSLLVVLGMLGTFLGMVVTLKGAVLALESTTDLATIRAALAAPVKGLGLAFGTSVAGVAASAMLGLVSALCRRERLDAAQRLDTRIATTLRAFSLAHQRQLTLQTLQRLLAGQEQFQHHAQSTHAALAASVERSLKEALVESARTAGATLQPVAEATMAGMAREAAAFQQRLAGSVEQQAAALLGTVAQAHTALRADVAAGEQQRLAAWSGALTAMTAGLQHEWQQAGAQALARQERICQTLEQTAGAMQLQAEAHARNTIAELSRLIDSAAEAPRAAAAVTALLRERLSDSMARDNHLLDERARLMGTLATLLDAASRAATEQRGAIDALVGSASTLLQQAGTQFGARLEAESARIGNAAAQVAGSAVEVASLGEAFGAAVLQFGASSEALTVNLQRIEAAFDKSSARSDEQLGYYVAQAREIIDLSISSQRQIVDDLQQLAHRRDVVAEGAAA